MHSFTVFLKGSETISTKHGDLPVLQAGAFYAPTFQRIRTSQHASLIALLLFVLKKRIALPCPMFLNKQKQCVSRLPDNSLMEVPLDSTRLEPKLYVG